MPTRGPAAPKRSRNLDPLPEPSEPPATPLQAAEPGVMQRIAYRHAQGVDSFVRHVLAATPTELVETERSGVSASFVKDLAERLGLPVSHVYAMIGLPKATAERKAAAGESVAGSAGLAALGLARLLGMAQELVDDSTAAQARGFDAGAWLGRWLQRPQPALGGLAPAAFVDTPTGLKVVMRLLGALESGAYQ